MSPPVIVEVNGEELSGEVTVAIELSDDEKSTESAFPLVTVAWAARVPVWPDSTVIGFGCRFTLQLIHAGNTVGLDKAAGDSVQIPLALIRER